jgi:hypothetical protein
LSISFRLLGGTPLRLLLWSTLLISLAASAASPTIKTANAKTSKRKSKSATTPPALAVETPAPPPVASTEPVKLAINAISVVNLPQSFSGFYAEHAAQELSSWGLRVVTSREIQSLLGFERQKQLMGCSDESSSCIAELANALGVDGLVLGDIARFGNVYQMNMKVIAAASAKVLASYSERVAKEEALLDAYSRAAAKLAQEVNAGMGRAPPVRSANPAVVSTNYERPSMTVKPYRKYSWVPASAAVASGIAGALLFSSARRDHATLTNSQNLTIAQANSLRARGSRSQTWASVALGVSAAALGTAATMFFWTRDVSTESPVSEAPQISFTPMGLVVAGSFP